MKKFILIAMLVAAEAGLLIAIQEHDPCNVFGRTMCPWCECHENVAKNIWIHKRISDTGEGVMVR